MTKYIIIIAGVIVFALFMLNEIIVYKKKYNELFKYFYEAYNKGDWIVLGCKKNYIARNKKDGKLYNCEESEEKFIVYINDCVGIGLRKKENKGRNNE